MVVFTVKAGKKKIAAIVLTVIAVLAGLFGIKAIYGQLDNKTEKFPGGTKEERIAFIESFGWKVDHESQIKKEITIPSDFNEEYIDYNEKQISCGFDLQLYKGENADMYSYCLNDNDKAFARVLVYEGTIIGADICDIENGGKVYCINDNSIFKSKSNEGFDEGAFDTVETILPDVNDGAWPVD